MPMSLILDALRKMEQDRKSRRGAALDIRPEVLRYRGAVPRQEPKHPYLFPAVGILLLLAGIGARVLWRGNSATAVSAGSDSTASSSPTAAALPTAATAATAPMAATGAPAPVTAAPAMTATPPLATAAASTPAAASAALPAAAPPAPKVAPDRAIAPATAQQAAVSDSVASSGSKRDRKRAAAAKSSHREAPGISQSQPQHRAAAEELQTIPEISISGIAWQDERSLRRAVLNGQLVGEGAEVAGARVVEIRETKVRLSRGGQLFDVVFSSGFPSR